MLGLAPKRKFFVVFAACYVVFDGEVVVVKRCPDAYRNKELRFNGSLARATGAPILNGV